MCLLRRFARHRNPGHWSPNNEQHLHHSVANMWTSSTLMALKEPNMTGACWLATTTTLFKRPLLLKEIRLLCSPTRCRLSVWWDSFSLWLSTFSKLEKWKTRHSKYFRYYPRRPPERQRATANCGGKLACVQFVLVANSKFLLRRSLPLSRRRK